MEVVLGKFACFCLETRFGSDFATGVQVALHHYTRRLKSHREPIVVPAFHLGGRPDGVDVEAEFDLAVEPEIEAILKREARRQAVPVEQLLTHAVFVYIADLDAAAHHAA